MKREALLTCRTMIPPDSMASISISLALNNNNNNNRNFMHPHPHHLYNSSNKDHPRLNRKNSMILQTPTKSTNHLPQEKVQR